MGGEAAGAQASQAGSRGIGEQNRADRMGRDDKRRELRGTGGCVTWIHITFHHRVVWIGEDGLT